MTPQAAARPYATALLTAVGSDEAGVATDAALNALSTAYSTHPDLRNALTSPVIPVARKRAVVEQLVDGLSGAPPALKRLVGLLADGDRLDLLPELSRAFSARLRHARGVVDAEVVTAQPLPDGTRAALTSALSTAVGGSVRLAERVDPALVGGVVAKVGSTVFDGSITRQLERLRQKLLADV